MLLTVLPLSPFHPNILQTHSWYCMLLSTRKVTFWFTVPNSSPTRCTCWHGSIQYTQHAWQSWLKYLQQQWLIFLHSSESLWRHCCHAGYPSVFCTALAGSKFIASQLFPLLKPKLALLLASIAPLEPTYAKSDFSPMPIKLPFVLKVSTALEKHKSGNYLDCLWIFLLWWVLRPDPSRCWDYQEL